MNKNFSVESLENQVYQITIANLANSEDIKTDIDAIEFNDVEMPLELFKNCFFNNNYRFFELNNQYSHLDELKIHNKTIKSSNFKNYKNGTKLDLIDVISYKFIKNKKTKISDVAKMYLIKDLSLYNSLLDFKIYNTHLSFDNIVSIYNMYINRKTKKYFRFKIKAAYYSADLDETLSLYFNYLVKIPKKSNKIKDLVEDLVEDTDENFDEQTTSEPVLNINKVGTLENIVYSNYTKKVEKEKKTNTTSSESTTINVDDNEDENENENENENDDTISESNMSDSSFEINESDDPFF